MKKFSILLLTAFALAAASCDESPEVPPMQSNPQEPILAAGDIAGTDAGVLAQSGVLNLETAPAAVEVFKFTKIEGLPAGATLAPVMQLSNSADFDKVQSVALSYDDATDAYTASTIDWNEAHVALFGKSPKEKTAYYRIPVYIAYGGTDYRYQSTDFYAASGQIVETCMDAGFTISQSYYLIGQQNDWTLTQDALNPYKFSHSDADVYDDPVFTLTVDVPDNCWWKIVPQEAIPDQDWSMLYGPATDGDTAMEGMLVDGGQSGLIVEGGKYFFTINMETMEYTIKPITYPVYLCTPGNANGWSQNASNWIPYVEDQGCNLGAIILDGGFKFTDGDTWDNDKTYGMGDAEGQLAQPGSDMSAPLGLYWAKVNTLALTYELTPITSLGVIGGFNNWGGQENLTPSADFRTWTGTVTIPADNNEWKIRMNDNWDMNYGGSLENPVFNGSNIAMSGTLNITVDFSGNLPVITVH